MVKTKINLISLMVLLLLTQAKAAGESAPTPEYQVKAAFLYNFIKFVDWTQQKGTDSNDVFMIGILGEENPFGSAFDAASKELIRNRKLEIHYFGAFSKIDESRQNAPDQYHLTISDLKNCHILFIRSSEASFVPQIIDAVGNAGTLTVSELPQFLDAGGAINFVLENDKILFEINLVAIEQQRIEIRSQLLRIAKKVVGKGKEKTK